MGFFIHSKGDRLGCGRVMFMLFMFKLELLPLADGWPDWTLLDPLLFILFMSGLLPLEPKMPGCWCWAGDPALLNPSLPANPESGE